MLVLLKKAFSLKDVSFVSSRLVFAPIISQKPIFAERAFLSHFFSVSTTHEQQKRVRLIDGGAPISQASMQRGGTKEEGGEGVSYYYCLYALLKKVMFSCEGKRVQWKVLTFSVAEVARWKGAMKKGDGLLLLLLSRCKKVLK